jgi:hypothetical protein
MLPREPGPARASEWHSEALSGNTICHAARGELDLVIHVADKLFVFNAQIN